MTWFMIRIEGEGLDVKIVGDRPVLWGIFTVKSKLGITGFYATRYLEAADADAAIDLASSSIKNDLAVSKTKCNTGVNGLNRPAIVVEPCAQHKQRVAFSNQAFLEDGY